MGKFDKREVCEYCNEKMESKNRNKRFCSDKCRVYCNRENKKRKPLAATKQDNVGQPSSAFWEKMRNKRLGM